MPETKEIRPLGIITTENGRDVLQRLTAPFKQSEVLSRILQAPKPGTPVDKLSGRFKPNGFNGWNKHKEVVAVAPIAFYVDARAIYDRLDKVVGAQNWQSRTVMYNDGVITELGIKIDGEWIWKADGSGYTDIESTKGGISKGIVRAAVSWGIGRYFYDINEFFPIKQFGSKWVFDNKWNGSWQEPQVPAQFLPSK